MAESFGPGYGSFPSSSTASSDSSPWVWVLIPVGIVVAVGGLAVCLHSRRRQRLTCLLPTSSAPNNAPSTSYTRSRAVNERDIEDAWVRGAPSVRHQRSTVPSPGGRWSQTDGAVGSRWYWAGSEHRRLPRPEEGLNELGEAPPPYEKAKIKSQPSCSNLSQSLNGEGPAPKSNSVSSASSLRHADGNGSGNDEMEMHTLAPAMTGRTLTTVTTLTTERSTASSVSDGLGGLSATDVISPFSFSGVPSTAASSVLERGLSPPPYFGLPAPVLTLAPAVAQDSLGMAEYLSPAGLASVSAVAAAPALSAPQSALAPPTPSAAPTAIASPAVPAVPAPPPAPSHPSQLPPAPTVEEVEDEERGGHHSPEASGNAVGGGNGGGSVNHPPPAVLPGER